MKHSKSTASVLSCLVLFIASALSLNAHATVRCANAAGAVVAYAESALACPAGSSAKGDIAAASQPTASQMAQAKAQAQSDKQTGDAMEAKRLKEERAQAKAIAALQKNKDAKAKRCKAADLSLKKAQDRYKDSPTASKGKKAGKAGKHDTHTVIRDEDSKAGKSKRKAKNALDNAQAKRDLACND